MNDIKNETKCRSWFCVWNNPCEHDESLLTLTPEEIAEKVLSMWIGDSETKSGAVAYCISAKGLHHLHMVLCDTRQQRFSAVKKIFGAAHLEPTMGTKSDAEDYIFKRGKFEEKGETVVYVATHGELIGKVKKKSVLASIQEMLELGMTPSEIMNIDISYRQYERMIKGAFFDIRRKNLPIKRDINVVWHVGKSGSGKSYTFVKLVEERGEDNVYMYTDYQNGGFDTYCAEPVLFMDEFRGQMPYNNFLIMLDGYKVQMHSRYVNTYALWSEVHITSVFPPDMLYNKMIEENRDIDTYEQLKRRITTIIYHYKDNYGNYCSYEMPMSEYVSYDDLKSRAYGSDFLPLDDCFELPLD